MRVFASSTGLSLVVIPLRQLHPRAQHLSNAPCLSDASARRERRLGVEYFAE